MPGVVPGGTALGSVRTVPSVEPIPIREQAVDIRCGERGLDQPLDDAGDDQADEEDQPRADQPRQEGEDLVQQLVDWGEDLADAEEAQRGHDPDKPDDQLRDGADLVADRLVRRSRDVLAQRGGTIDAFLEHPLHGARNRPGRDEDEDGDEDLGAPVHHLSLPISALVDLIHWAVLP